MTQIQSSEITGIEIIDEQHQQILNLIDGINKALADGDRNQIELAINQVYTHIIAHFEFEEQLMEQVGYPFLNVHRRLHDYFLQHLAEHTQRFDAGEDVVAELLVFASNWLHSHFVNEDRDYSPQVLTEMKMKGLTGEARLMTP